MTVKSLVKDVSDGNQGLTDLCCIKFDSRHILWWNSLLVCLFLDKAKGECLEWQFASIDIYHAKEAVGSAEGVAT